MFGYKTPSLGVVKNLITGNRPIVPGDYSPGGNIILAGDTNAGFLGFVPASELITGDQLALDLGATAGSSQNSNTPWIKYVWGGKVCFTPLKTIRYSIPWDAIYEAGAVHGDDSIGVLPPEGRLGTELTIDETDNSINTTGHFLGDKSSDMDYYDTVAEVGETLVLDGWNNEENNGEFVVDSITDAKIIVTGGTLVSEVGSRTTRMYPKINEVAQSAKVTIDGLEYTVRLFRGASNDLTNSYADGDRDSVGEDNEWNAIILPLHERAKTQNWNYAQYAGTTEDWGVYLTDEDLRTHRDFGNGSCSWCQEVRDDNETFRRVRRGYSGASYLDAGTSWHTSSYDGWLPVLELPQTATL